MTPPPSNRKRNVLHAFKASQVLVAEVAMPMAAIGIVSSSRCREKDCFDKKWSSKHAGCETCPKLTQMSESGRFNGRDCVSIAKLHLAGRQRSSLISQEQNVDR